MDVNPYQSPRPENEPESSVTDADDNRGPPSRWEIVNFGAMIGILYHSAAGFLAGIGWGVWNSIGEAAGNMVTMAMFGALAGAILGVVTGVAAGSLMAGLYSFGRRRRHVSFSRRLRLWRAFVWLLARLLHLRIGASIGGVFAISAPDSYASRDWLWLELLAGLAIGWLVGGLVDRRIRRTLDSLPDAAAGPNG